MAASFGSVEVDLAKLRDYCLSETHPRGRHKARVFRSRLGLSSADSLWLQKALTDAVHRAPDRLQDAGADNYGQRWRLDILLETEVGSALVRSAWIIPDGQDVLRLITCYVDQPAQS